MKTLSRLLPLYIVIFFGFIGYSLMLTIFTPMFLNTSSHILPHDSTKAYRLMILGIVLFLYPAGQFFGSPILGSLSDRFGRKPILCISLIFCCICYIFIALALHWESLSLLIVFSIIVGLSEANIAIAQAAIADTSTDANRTHLFGYIYVSASSAYIIGPLVGGKLADPNLVSWFSYATPFWITFILLAFTSIWIIVLFKETFPKEKRHAAHWLQPFANLLNIFRSSKISYIFLCNFLIYLSAFGFFRAYPMYLVNDYHLNVSHLSEFIAWVSVPMILANLFLLRILVKYLSIKHLYIVFTLLLAIFMVLIPLFSPLWTLWITLFFASLGISIAIPASVSLLSNEISAQHQGSALGNNQALQVGAEAISGVISAALATVFIQLPLFVLAISALVSIILILPLNVSE